MNIKLATVLLLSVVCSVHAEDWHYRGPHGPCYWSHFNPQCAGKRQSPININRLVTVPVKNATRLTLKNGDICPTSVTYANSGHGFALTHTYATEVQPTISGGPLGKDSYIFFNLHFHWKAEHVINSKLYEAEMHLVFYNSKYGSFAKAVTQVDGLAVLGFLCYIPSIKKIKFFDVVRPFLQPTSKIREPGSSFVQTENMSTFTLDFIIDGRENFNVWSYGGSLTSPSCDEAVTWMVVKEPFVINPSEIEFLKELMNKHGEKLLKTNRPVQPLNGRVIYSYGS